MELIRRHRSRQEYECKYLLRRRRRTRHEPEPIPQSRGRLVCACAKRPHLILKGTGGRFLGCKHEYRVFAWFRGENTLFVWFQQFCEAWFYFDWSINAKRRNFSRTKEKKFGIICIFKFKLKLNFRNKLSRFVRICLAEITSCLSNSLTSADLWKNKFIWKNNCLQRIATDREVV